MARQILRRPNYFLSTDKVWCWPPQNDIGMGFVILSQAKNLITQVGTDIEA